MLEKDFEEARQAAVRKVEAAASLDRLFSNPDFKSVIIDGLFKEEAAKLVSHSFNINLRDNWGLIVQEMQSISYLQNYFNRVLFEGQNAKEQLDNSYYNPANYGDE